MIEDLVKQRNEKDLLGIISMLLIVLTIIFSTISLYYPG